MSALRDVLILFCPAVAVFAAVFAYIDLTADPGGAWPPVAVALFTAVPIGLFVLLLTAIFLAARFFWHLGHM